MRSWRLVHPARQRFWEVYWEGTEAETTAGTLGTNGRSSAKDFLSAAATDAWVAEQVAKKRKEGFLELAAVGSSSAAPVLDEVLAEVRDRPDDDAPRLVYADKLSAAGDPLGEFIAAQVQLARAPTGPDAAVLRHRERELLERFRAQWSGGLRGVEFRFERGFAVEVKLEARELTEHAAKLWTIAPLLRSLRVTTEWSNLPAALEKLVAVPDAARLRELHLGSLGGTDERFVRVVAGAPALANLETLGVRRLGLTDAEAGELLGDGRLPKLVHVDLRGNALAGGALELLKARSLQSLNYAWNRLGRSSVHTLTRAALHATLERLDLSGNGIGDEGLAVLGAAPFAKLGELQLAGTSATAKGLEALARGPVAQTLTTLDLSENALGAAAAVVTSGAFPRLTHLDLSTTALGNEGLGRLLAGPGARALVSLELRNDGLTATGARQLVKAELPALRYLTVSGNTVGERVIEELRARFPAVQVVARRSKRRG